MSLKTQKRTRKAPKKITEEYLRNAGLYYLQRFASSKENFKRVLKRKVQKSCHAHQDQDMEMCMALVQKVADAYEQSGLLDDKAYAGSAISSLRRKGTSSRTIQGKMSLKGLNTELIEKQLQCIDAEQHHTPQDAERHAALTFARRKRIGPFRKAGIEANIQKELSCLARAGFSYDISTSILKIDEETAREEL